MWVPHRSNAQRGLTWMRQQETRTRFANCGKTGMLCATPVFSPSFVWMEAIQCAMLHHPHTQRKNTTHWTTFYNCVIFFFLLFYIWDSSQNVFNSTRIVCGCCASQMEFGRQVFGNFWGRIIAGEYWRELCDKGLSHLKNFIRFNYTWELLQDDVGGNNRWRMS